MNFSPNFGMPTYKYRRGQNVYTQILPRKLISWWSTRYFRRIVFKLIIIRIFRGLKSLHFYTPTPVILLSSRTSLTIITMMTNDCNFSPLKGWWHTTIVWRHIVIIKNDVKYYVYSKCWFCQSISKLNTPLPPLYTTEGYFRILVSFFPGPKDCIWDKKKLSNHPFSFSRILSFEKWSFYLSTRQL